MQVSGPVGPLVSPDDEQPPGCVGDGARRRRDAEPRLRRERDALAILAVRVRERRDRATPRERPSAVDRTQRDERVVVAVGCDEGDGAARRDERERERLGDRYAFRRRPRRAVVGARGEVRDVRAREAMDAPRPCEPDAATARGEREVEVAGIALHRQERLHLPPSVRACTRRDVDLRDRQVAELGRAEHEPLVAVGRDRDGRLVQVAVAAEERRPRVRRPARAPVRRAVDARVGEAVRRAAEEDARVGRRDRDRGRELHPRVVRDVLRAACDGEQNLDRLRLLVEIDQRARNAEDDGDAEGLEEERSDAVTAEQSPPIRRRNAGFCCYKRWYAGGAHGARRPPFLSAGRCGRRAARHPSRRHPRRLPDRVGRRLRRHRRARRRRPRDPARRLLGLSPLPRGVLMRAGLSETPRPVPGRLIPMLGGGLVLLVALPIFVLAGWPIGGWALGAVLWAGMQAMTLLLARVKERTGNLAAAGVQGFGLFFKAIALLVVLVAVAASDAHLAVAAALTYALAYTCELGLSLLTYFGGGAP